MKDSCCVPGCSVPNDSTTLYPLPLNLPLLMSTWKRICPFLEYFDAESIRKKRICKSHFRPDFIDENLNKLRNNAIPTLQLPMSELPKGNTVSLLTTSDAVVTTGCWSNEGNFQFK